MRVHPPLRSGDPPRAPRRFTSYLSSGSTPMTSPTALRVTLLSRPFPLRHVSPPIFPAQVSSLRAGIIRSARASESS